ncbi:hypothetical protein C8R34_10976 [Nitrosomonas sp. Nm84]|uniref:hypothetical protein n=1 Tax=Nitrosomonas sp. Nm84 TaxID=200124 RepID=UPI000D75743C|nr:hypothetical protein [Nitrosomonas sp. Nm84]PXW87828.1 hypothetical protein C8R34_10976 [Nitrosomonas sp. Nm84]
MIIKNYLPNSLEYTNQYSLTKFPDIDFNLRLPETINTSFLPSLPGRLPDFPIVRTWPDLPESIKPLPSVLPTYPGYTRDWEFDPTENTLIRIIIDPIHNWLEGTTKEDVLRFVFDKAQDIYESITDTLDLLKAQDESINPNQTFYNTTAASDDFNGGLGLDTVVYAGSRDDYRVYATQDILGKNTGYEVIENNGNATDTLVDIERLEFADGYSQLNVIGSYETFHPLV